MSESTTVADTVEGVVAEQGEGYIVLALPGTDYRLRLVVEAPVAAAPDAAAPAAGFAAAGENAAVAAATPDTPPGGAAAAVISPPAAPAPPRRRRVRGRIFARARRVDIVRAGGRYIEPVYGRPRRVQGRVIATDPAANALAVYCAPGCAIMATLTANQKAADFPVGALVSFDVEPGAKFVLGEH